MKMKVTPQRTLVRKPRANAEETKRRRAIDEVLDEVLREKPSKISLSKIVLESRR